jgi:hypothetical protein
VLLRGEVSKNNFAIGPKIGDIIFFDYFQVAYFDKKLQAIRPDHIEESKIRVYPI